MKTDKRLFVIDFDGTLLRNEANVIVRDRDGKSYTLTVSEYNSIKDEITGEIDFSEFETLKDPFPIRKHMGLLKSVLRNNLADKTVVISERKDPEPIIKYLKDNGIKKGVKVLALGKNDNSLRAKYIENQILRGYKKILYIDNSEQAISLVNEIGEKHEDVQLSAIYVGAGANSSGKGDSDKKYRSAKDSLGSKKDAGGVGDDSKYKRGNFPSQDDTRKRDKSKKDDTSTIYRGAIAQLSDKKVYNRDTRRDINLKTALSYPKDHPSHVQARNMVKALVKTKTRQLQQNIKDKNQSK